VTSQQTQRAIFYASHFINNLSNLSRETIKAFIFQQTNDFQQKTFLFNWRIYVDDYIRSILCN